MAQRAVNGCQNKLMFDPSVSAIGLYSRVMVKMSCLSLTVLWWIRDVNGPGSWKWSFQMWNGSRSSFQVGLLW